MIEAILASPPAPGEIALAVDGCQEGIFDLPDLTKVARQDGRVAAIGKDLVEWDGCDTGLFYCTNALFPAIARARAGDAHSLTDGVRECVAAGGVRAVDVSGQSWLDVDTPEAAAEAERRIRASLTKGQNDGFVAEYLNRAISQPISMRLARTPITPNQITIANFLLGLVGAAFLALADPAWWIAGGLIIQAASILDGCDGEVARLTYRQSARGGWLDTVLDRYGDAAVVDPASWIWVAGCASAVGFLMASYSTKEYHIRFGKPYPSTVVARLARRDLRLLVVAIGAITGYPFEALVAIGLLSHLSVLWILVLGEPPVRPAPPA
jgi:CDP-L-myo-inositol myo-inositolphosphotransferase